MSDIVERLRIYASQFEDQHAPEQIALALRAGADEIERLRAGGCARDQGTTQYCAEAAKKDAEIASLLNLLADARTESMRLRAALESVMVGGNSLAQIIGADHPPHGTPYGEALAHYGSGVKYEAWCCWNSIMRARAALEGK